MTTLTNRKRRAIHDFIASTVVVRNGVADMAEPAPFTPGLLLQCPRCGERNPSRYYFADPGDPASICIECARTERAERSTQDSSAADSSDPAPPRNPATSSTATRRDKR